MAASIAPMTRCAVTEWISQQLDERVEVDELVSKCEDGVLLCKLVNKLYSKSRNHNSKKAVKVAKAKKGSAKAKANVEAFLRAAEVFGVSKDKLFTVQDLIVDVNETAVVNTLYELGVVQRIVQPPRSSWIGMAIDANKLPDPGPEENSLLRESIAVLLVELGYDQVANPIKQINNSWRFIFGNIGPVPVYFIYGMVVARMDGHWIALARVLKQNGLLGSEASPTRSKADHTPVSSVKKSGAIFTPNSSFDTRGLGSNSEDPLALSSAGASMSMAEIRTPQGRHATAAQASAPGESIPTIALPRMSLAQNPGEIQQHGVVYADNAPVIQPPTYLASVERSATGSNVPAFTLPRMSMSANPDQSFRQHGVLFSDDSPGKAPNNQRTRRHMGMTMGGQPSPIRQQVAGHGNVPLARVAADTHSNGMLLETSDKSEKEPLNLGLGLSTIPGFADWIAKAESENTQLHAELTKLRRQSEQLQGQREEMEKDIRRATKELSLKSVQLEKTKEKLDYIQSDGYEQAIEQTIETTQEEIRSASEMREAALHNRLREHQFFSDLKDREREAQFKRLLAAECDAIEKRLRANHMKDLSEKDAERMRQLTTLDEAYRDSQSKLQATILMLRKRLRGVQARGQQESMMRSPDNDGVSVQFRDQSLSLDLDGMVTVPGSRVTSPVKEFKGQQKSGENDRQAEIQELRRKLEKAEAETKAFAVKSAQDKENLANKHDATVDRLVAQLRAAEIAGRRQLLEQQSVLRSEYAGKIAALESRLADKTSELDDTLAAADTSILSENAQHEADRQARRLKELGAKIAQLELELAEGGAGRKRELSEQHDRLDALHSKAMRDLQAGFDRERSQLEAQLARAKEDALGQREAHARDLAAQRLTADEARRKLELAADSAKRTAVGDVNMAHQSALDDLRKSNVDQLRAADARHHELTEELHDKIAAQLRDLQNLHSELADAKLVVKEVQLAKADVEAQLAAAKQQAASRANEETDEVIKGLRTRIAELEEEKRSAARAAASQAQQLQDERQDALKNLRQAHEQELKARQAAFKNSESEQDRTRQDELDRIRGQAKEEKEAATKRERELQDALQKAARNHADEMAKAAKIAAADLASARSSINDQAASSAANTANLQDALDKANAKIAELELEIIRLKARIAELEAMLEKQQATTENQMKRHDKLADEHSKLQVEVANAKAKAKSTAAEHELVVAQLTHERDAAFAQLAQDTEKQQQALKDISAEAERLKALAETKEREAVAAQKEIDAAAAAVAEEAAKRHQAELVAEDAQRKAADAEAVAKVQLLEEEKLLRETLQKEREDAEEMALEEARWREQQAETQRLKNIKENDQLIPFRADLCEWIGKMLSIKLEPDTLLRDLANGEKLCDLAMAIDRQERKLRQQEALNEKAGFTTNTLKGKSIKKPKVGAPGGIIAKREKRLHQLPQPRVKKAPGDAFSRYLPDDPIANRDLAEKLRKREFITLRVQRDAQRGTKEARSNIHEFFRWSRTLGLSNPDIFEEDDLVMYSGEKSVYFGLYDVARRCRDTVPNYITFERARYHPRVRSNLSENDVVDLQADKILRECICTPRHELVKTSDTKYLILPENKNVSLKVVNNQVVVRVGGGWTDFKSYIKDFDRCRKDKPLQERLKTYNALQEKLVNHKKLTKNGAAHIALFTNRLAQTLEANAVPKKKKAKKDDSGSSKMDATDSLDKSAVPEEVGVPEP